MAFTFSHFHDASLYLCGIFPLQVYSSSFNICVSLLFNKTRCHSFTDINQNHFKNNRKFYWNRQRLFLHDEFTAIRSMLVTFMTHNPLQKCFTSFSMERSLSKQEWYFYSFFFLFEYFLSKTFSDIVKKRHFHSLQFVYGECDVLTKITPL